MTICTTIEERRDYLNDAKAALAKVTMYTPTKRTKTTITPKEQLSLF